MATTLGRVLKLTWQADLVCVWVGSSLSSASILFLQFEAPASEFTLQGQRVLVKMLASALSSRWPVAIGHAENESRVLSVEFQGPDIALVGPAIHGDFLSVTGTNLPNDVEIVFRQGLLEVSVQPGLRRPHWVLLEALPAAVPAGACIMFLRGAGFQTGAIPVTVAAGGPLRKRVLYGGRTTTGAYTIAFAATPGRVTGAGTVVVDGSLSDRPAFHAHVVHCLGNLLTLDESLLRTDNMDRAMRFVAIFDTTLTADVNTALVGEVSPDILEPQRDRVGAFANRFQERADVVYCISASSTHTRASAWWGADVAAPVGGNFTYDGTARAHGLRAQRPGCIAQSTHMDTTGLTALHEFGHAASDESNGMVTDLYVDDTRVGFVVNKKMRSQSSDPVPANFATMNTTTYAADAARDGIGYPSDWVSYHPALQVTNRPNLMDNYWLAGANKLQCRFDGLTFDWYRRRLQAKVSRPE